MLRSHYVLFHYVKQRAGQAEVERSDRFKNPSKVSWYEVQFGTRIQTDPLQSSLARKHNSCVLVSQKNQKIFAKMCSHEWQW